MNGVEIRDATKEDISVILGLLYELGRPKPNDNQEELMFENKIKQYLSDTDKQILVAQINTEIIGIISMIFLTRLNQTQLELYIPELIVRDEYRNHKVGEKLINSCIEIGKKKKCHRIRLESGNQRKDSHVFYKRLGFEQDSLSFSMDIK